MGQIRFLSQYNPFTIEGRYNIKAFLYSNKREALMVLLIIWLLSIATIISI